MQKCDAAQAKLHDLLAEMQRSKSASASHIADVEAKLKAAENASDAARCSASEACLERDQLQTQLSEMTEKEAKVRSQAKEAVEKLKEKLKSVTESEAASKARVAELESAIAGVGSETTQQLDTLRKELTDSESASSEYMQKCASQIEALRASLCEAERNHTSFESSAAQRLNDSETKCQALRDTASKLQEKNEVLKAKCQELFTSQTNLREQVSEFGKVITEKELELKLI
jgi:chromosome segregation ATPase